MEQSFSETFLDEATRIISRIDTASIEKVARVLAETRERGGRLFLLGVGGSAASASHAANDFRKLCDFEAYCPSDNVSELTARVNDDGWEDIFAAWLKGSRLNEKDAILIFSVGGGDTEHNVSVNLVRALKYARSVGAAITGIVGRDGGYTGRNADACALVPTVNAVHVTPHTEAFHGIIWHLLVSHPLLKTAPAKWESLASA